MYGGILDEAWDDRKIVIKDFSKMIDFICK